MFVTKSNRPTRGEGRGRRFALATNSFHQALFRSCRHHRGILRPSGAPCFVALARPHRRLLLPAGHCGQRLLAAGETLWFVSFHRLRETTQPLSDCLSCGWSCNEKDGPGRLFKACTSSRSVAHPPARDERKGAQHEHESGQDEHVGPHSDAHKPEIHERLLVICSAVQR